jgi:putative ABC transport system permease protein
VIATYRGWNERFTAYIDHTDDDIWVVQKGSESFFSPSVIAAGNVQLAACTDEVADAIRKANPTLEVVSRGVFSANTRRLLQSSILPILAVVVVLAFGVGTIVVGLTMYTSTIEKEREFGVLKALGTTRLRLVWIVLEQSLICCLAGFVVGAACSLVAIRMTTLVVPQFVTVIALRDIAGVFLGVMAMGIIASWLPIQRIIRLSPLEVFKA